jgi:hypothetical protein
MYFHSIFSSSFGKNLFAARSANVVSDPKGLSSQRRVAIFRRTELASLTVYEQPIFPRFPQIIPEALRRAVGSNGPPDVVLRKAALGAAASTKTQPQ